MIALRLVRDGAVVREVVFAQLPVSLGRGPENDFVVPDASVSRLHARLEQDGEGRLMLRDLGSVNGLHVGPARVESEPVAGRLRCRVGLVEIEIEPVSQDATQPIRPEEWRRFEQRRTLGQNLRYVALGAVGWIVLLVLDPSYWSPWQKNRAGMLLGSTLGMLIGLPVVSFLVFVALKAAGRLVRVADTLRALARLVWVWPPWLMLSAGSYYLLSVSAHALLGEVVTWAAVMASVVYAASVRRHGPHRAFRLGWALAVTGLWVGLHFVGAVAARKTGTPQNEYSLQAPLGGFAGVSKDLDVYLAEVRQASEGAAREADDVRVSQQGR